MTTPLKYLQHYPAHLQESIRALLERDQLGDYITQKYPHLHTFNTDSALYTYTNDIKQQYLRNAPPLAKVLFDNRLTIDHHALGLNTAISRVQGGKLTAKKEIRIASTFKTCPTEFLNMIVVHELAHLKERDHNKAFYQLCVHMQPDYHQLEFDMRVYLLWQSTQKEITERTI